MRTRLSERPFQIYWEGIKKPSECHYEGEPVHLSRSLAQPTTSTLTVLNAIGNTPIVQLRRIVPSGSARILAKLEFTNPTGSMKDRVAKAMVEKAERDGRLKPGGTVVEYTAG